MDDETHQLRLNGWSIHFSEGVIHISDRGSVPVEIDRLLQSAQRLWVFSNEAACAVWMQTYCMRVVDSECEVQLACMSRVERLPNAIA